MLQTIVYSPMLMKILLGGKTMDEKISQCPHCYCMTKTITKDYGKKQCGKCGKDKDTRPTTHY